MKSKFFFVAKKKYFVFQESNLLSAICRYFVAEGRKPFVSMVLERTTTIYLRKWEGNIFLKWIGFLAQVIYYFIFLNARRKVKVLLKDYLKRLINFPTKKIVHVRFERNSNWRNYLLRIPYVLSCWFSHFDYWIKPLHRYVKDTLSALF